MENQKEINNKSTTVEQFAPDLDSPIKLSNQPSKFKTLVAGQRKKIIVIIIAVLALGGIGLGVKSIVDLVKAKKELEAIKNDPNAKAKEETKSLVQQVGKLVVLPEDEEPTVATVTDPAKLADQPFFANSKSGDKVLIYQNASRAILYRPSDNKVIEIAPLTLGNESSLSEQAQQVSPSFPEDSSQPSP